MDQNNDILDGNSSGNSHEEEIIISENKFMFFCFISFGLYQVWWMYKAWRYFQQRENLDIMPAARALFSIFFLHGLFTRIQDSALLKGYGKETAVTGNYIAYIIFSMCSRLPDPFWLISLLNFTFLLPAFRELNYIKMNTKEITIVEQNYLNGRQIALISFGGIFWYLVITSLFFSNPFLKNI